MSEALNTLKVSPYVLKIIWLSISRFFFECIGLFCTHVYSFCMLQYVIYLEIVWCRWYLFEMKNELLEYCRLCIDLLAQVKKCSVCAKRLLLLLLSALLSPKGWLIKANPQAWRYFNSGSQAAVGHMLSELVSVQLGEVSNLKMMSRNISSPLSLTYPIFFMYGPELVSSIAVFSRTSLLCTC